MSASSRVMLHDIYHGQGVLRDSFTACGHDGVWLIGWRKPGGAKGAVVSFYSGRELHMLIGHGGHVSAICVDIILRDPITASRDGSIIVSPLGKPLRIVFPFKGEIVTCMQLLPN